VKMTKSKRDKKRALTGGSDALSTLEKVIVLCDTVLLKSFDTNGVMTG